MRKVSDVCKPRYGLVGVGKCQLCPAGTQAVAHVCTACPTGKVSVDGQPCHACSGGVGRKP